MGRQNIVSGGFYGKVGALIGQRWHNIRTVRAYTKPTNPRTEKQQANRRTFADLTKNSQIGQGMNYNAPCFSEIDNSEWGIRMACASQLKKAGQSGLNLIPLFPYGYIPQFAIRKITLEETQGTTKAVFSVEGDIPTNERDLSILVSTKPTKEDPATIELYRAILNSGASQTFTIDGINVTELNDYTKMLIVSNDDKENNDEMVYAPEQGIELPQIVTRNFNSSVAGVQRNDKTFTITFAEPFVDGDYEIGSMKITGISNGEEKSMYFTPLTFINNNGYFAVSVTQDVQDDSEILAFPQGSSLLITKIKVVSERLILVLDTEQYQSFDNSDLTRPFYTEIDEDIDPGENDEILFFKQNLQNAISNPIKADFFEMSEYLKWNKTPVSLNLAVRNGKAAIIAEEDLNNYLQVEKTATFPTLKGTAENVTYESENVSFTYEGKNGDYLLLEKPIPLSVMGSDDHGCVVRVDISEMEEANWQSAREFEEMLRIIGGQDLKNVNIKCKIGGIQTIRPLINLRKIEYMYNTTLFFYFNVDADLRYADDMTLEKTSASVNRITLFAKELGLPIASFTL